MAYAGRTSWKTITREIAESLGTVNDTADSFVCNIANKLSKFLNYK